MQKNYKPAIMYINRATKVFSSFGSLLLKICEWLHESVIFYADSQLTEVFLVEKMQQSIF